MSQFAQEIMLMVVAGLLGGLAARALKQPLLLGYLVAGAVIGPYTGLIGGSDITRISMLADVGAALLLFTLGLEFPLKSLRPIRGIAFYGAGIQVVLTFAYCWGVGWALGFPGSQALWFAAGMVSSSTAVILKTLSNQGYSGSLSGRIMLGMSIVQDLAVIPIMILLCNLQRGDGNWFGVVRPILYAVGFVLLMGGIGSRLATRLFRWVARLHSGELFLLVTTSLALGIGALTGYFGLSFAFGAFVAGMVLSESDYSRKALSELGPLRDIFVLIFFVSVGMLCDPRFLWEHWPLILAVLTLATIGRGLILMGVAYLFGYRRVVPFAVLFGMLPISEMSFVLIQQGRSLEAISNDTYSLILNVTILSMLLGPLGAALTQPVYRWFRKLVPERVQPLREVDWSEPEPNEVLIAGGGRFSAELAETLIGIGRRCRVIEPQHQEFEEARDRRLPVLFGDPAQPVILNAAGVAQARLLVVAAGSVLETRSVVESARELNPELPIIAVLDQHDEPGKSAWPPGVEILPAPLAVRFETLRRILPVLGWGLPEIHNLMLRLLPEQVRHDAGRDRHGFPLLLQFLGTAARQVRSGGLAGRTIRESGLREEHGVWVIGVSRGEHFLPLPDGDFELQAGDWLLLLGSTEACETLNQEVPADGQT